MLRSLSCCYSLSNDLQERSNLETKRKNKQDKQKDVSFSFYIRRTRVLLLMLLRDSSVADETTSRKNNYDDI